MEHLDALRGGAALLVVLQHSLQFTVEHGPYAWPLLNVINTGRLGVLLFFLISGFVIPFSFHGRAPIRGFIVSRASRLLPALWLSVATELTFLAYAGQFVDGWTILANMAMVARPLGFMELHLGYWTLSLELWFYGLCVIVFLIGGLRNVRLIGTLALFLMLFAAIRNEIYLYAAYFLTGLVLRLAILEGDDRAGPWAVIVSIVLVSVSAWTGAYPSSNVFLSPMSRSIAAASAVPIFLAVVFLKPKIPGWLLYLGAISYSVYLFQNAAFIVCEPLLGPSFANVILYVVAVLAVTIGISAVVYRFLERPAMDLGRTLKRKLEVAPIPA